MDVIRRAAIFRRATPGWAPFILPTGARTVAVVCPACNRVFHLGAHAIALDGAVSPSVVCPWAGCSYHAFVRLDAWGAA